MKTHSNSLWIIGLPEDWHQVATDSEKSTQFGNHDEMQKVYLGAWTVPAYEDSVQFLRTHQDKESHRLSMMDDNDFEILDDRVERIGSLTIGLLDALDKAQNFRMAFKTVLIGDLLLRCSFHDYWCSDLAESNTVSVPIMRSFDFAGPK